ncbi:MAG: MFS transporter [Thermoanaerobaculia bacterium]
MERSDIAPDSPAAGRLPPTVVRLGWVSLLTDVSSEMIVPLLPAFLATLPGAPAMALGWIEGIAETTASGAKILSGRWADRAKAKKPLVFLGYGLSSVARPLIGLAPVWPVVALVRFFDRIGKGIRGAPRDTMIAAAAPLERRGAAFGLHRAFDNAGAVLGPVLAAALVGAAGLSFRSVFLLAAIPAALSLIVLGFLVHEKKKESDGVPSDASAHCLSEASLRAKEEGAPSGELPPAFWRVAGVVGFFTLAASSDTFILLRARDLGIAAAWLPLIWSFSNGVKSIFSTWGGGLSDRFGRRTLLLSAWGLYAACYAGFAFVTSAPLLVGLVGVYSLYYSLSEGTERALVTDLVPIRLRGRAFGWFNAMTGLAALPASAGFGLVWEHYGAQAAFLTGAGIAAAAAGALLVLVPGRRAHESR